MTFRGQLYNLLNETNFAAPTVEATNAAFGRAGSTFDPRFVQLALKLGF